MNIHARRCDKTWSKPWTEAECAIGLGMIIGRSLFAPQGLRDLFKSEGEGISPPAAFGRCSDCNFIFIVSNRVYRDQIHGPCKV